MSIIMAIHSSSLIAGCSLLGWSMGKDRIGGKPSTMNFSGLMLFSARARAWRESNILCVLQDKVGYNKEVNSYVCKCLYKVLLWAPCTCSKWRLTCSFIRR